MPQNCPRLLRMFETESEASPKSLMDLRKRVESIVDTTHAPITIALEPALATSAAPGVSLGSTNAPWQPVFADPSS